MGNSVNSPGLDKIDVAEVLASKSPALAKWIPKFLVDYLKKTIHQEEINDILYRYRELRDAPFAAATLDYLGVNYKVIGEENIPSKGRYIFVSNHPLGGLDGLVFITEMARHYPEIKFPVNDLLTFIKNLNGVFLGINKHGSQGRQASEKLEEAYSSDCQILYFPAGLCSRKTGGEIRDLEWQKSFITKAIQHQRDVVPVYFSGRNSNFFYNLANIRKKLGIKANLEMLYLPDEMFCQKGKRLVLTFGKPIPWQRFDNSKRPAEWAAWVKEISYSLAENQKNSTLRE